MIKSNVCMFVIRIRCNIKKLMIIITTKKAMKQKKSAKVPFLFKIMKIKFMKVKKAPVIDDDKTKLDIIKSH